MDPAGFSVNQGQTLMNWSQEKLQSTAQALLDARVSGKARDTFVVPDIPPNLETAYAVQSKAVGLWDGELAGFKVGGIPQHFRDQFPAEWLAGPVFANNVFHMKHGETLDFPVFQDGFAAFEPELVFEVSSDAWQAHDVWTAELAGKTIERIFVGAEIAASPNINVNALGPGSIISDFGNNAGVILGDEVALSD